jgi:nitrogen fixation/metabolism regulation signal transduction histidine kinase
MVAPTLGVAGTAGSLAWLLWETVEEIRDEGREAHAIARLTDAFHHVVAPVQRYVVEQDPASRAEFERRLLDVREALRELDELSAEAYTAEERAAARHVEGILSAMEAIGRAIFAASPRMEHEVHGQVLQLGRLADQASDTLHRMLEGTSGEVRAAVARAAQAIRWASWAATGILLVAGAVGLGLAVRLSARLSRPIAAIAQASERIAASDLAERVAVEADGEVGQAARAFNAIAEALARGRPATRWAGWSGRGRTSSARGARDAASGED